MTPLASIAERLRRYCECDGRGCAVCEASDLLAAAHAREAALVKERDEAREMASRLEGQAEMAIRGLESVAAKNAAMAEAYEKARAALKEYARAANWATVPGAGRTGSDFACAWIGPMGPCVADALAREALAAPTPDMEQWRRERELRDAARELAEHCANSDLRFDDQSTWYLMRDQLIQKFATLRTQRAATPEEKS